MMYFLRKTFLFSFRNMAYKEIIVVFLILSAAGFHAAALYIDYIDFRREKTENPGFKKTLGARIKNQQQTQPTYKSLAGIKPGQHCGEVSAYPTAISFSILKTSSAFFSLSIFFLTNAPQYFDTE